MNLFGRKKAAPAPAPRSGGGKNLAASIGKLKAASEQLDKREAHLNKMIANCLDEAKKKSKAKDKRGALFQLKRKKMFEKQVEQIYGKKTNLEMQIMTLESAQSNKDILDAMVQGNAAISQTLKQTDVDTVEETMDSINENMAMAEEVADAMSQSIGPVMDEDELGDELAELEAEMVEDELTNIPSVPTTTVQQPPAVVAPAASAPVKAQTAEEKELAELEAMMGM